MQVIPQSCWELAQNEKEIINFTIFVKYFEEGVKRCPLLWRHFPKFFKVVSKQYTAIYQYKQYIFHFIFVLNSR